MGITTAWPKLQFATGLFGDPLSEVLIRYKEYVLILWNFFHDLYPVWMMSDSLAATLYQGENSPELDWVIVWEHQEIEPAVWKALAPKVKHWVFIGQPGGKMWDQLRENEWPAYPIASMPSKLVVDKLAPETETSSAAEITIVQVPGLYDDSKRTNEAEAKEVMRLLNEIRPTPARTFPSVAILTLTTEQRDLISTYLLQIKQRNLQGSEKIRSLERNGLAVFHVDEFLGSSFDQFILSTTFGPVNVQGALPNSLIYFASSNWRRALEGFRPGAGIVLHSYSEGQLSEPELSSFAGFLDQITGKNAAASTHEGLRPIPPFNQEIESRIQNYFDGWSLSQVAPEDLFHLPVLLKYSNDMEYRAAIIADLFFGKTDHTSYTWEWKIRQQLEELGIHPHNAWSVLSWRNPRQEARKLASRVLTTYNRLLKEGAKEDEDIPPTEEETKPEPPESDAE